MPGIMPGAAAPTMPPIGAVGGADPTTVPAGIDICIAVVAATCACCCCCAAAVAAA